jgi:deoxycytidylate deaminase
MAALLVNGGRVISQGVNSTAPGFLKDKRYDLSRNGNKVGIHAELMAILRAPKGSTKGGIIFVAGWSQGGKLIHSKPCERCQALLKEHGIKKVVYYDEFGSEAVVMI